MKSITYILSLGQESSLNFKMKKWSEPKEESQIKVCDDEPKLPGEDCERLSRARHGDEILTSCLWANS